MNIEKAIATEETHMFLKVANEFCSELENGTTTELDFYNLLFILLSSLNFRAAQLHEITLKFNQHIDHFLAEEERNALLSKTSKRLGDERFYRMNFDPTDDTDKELVAGDPLDDLGDIYVDIKPCLVLIKLEGLAEQEHALWELKFSFDTHWGHHIVNAIRTLYHLTKY